MINSDFLATPLRSAYPHSRGRTASLLSSSHSALPILTPVLKSIIKPVLHKHQLCHKEPNSYPPNQSTFPDRSYNPNTRLIFSFGSSASQMRGNLSILTSPLIIFTSKPSLCEPRRCTATDVVLFSVLKTPRGF